MKKGCVLTLLFALMVADIACRRPPQHEHLIVISMDGLAPQHYLHADSLHAGIPNLRGLMQRGVYSTGMRTVYPSVTYPAHASMVTGVRPGRHGIFANARYEGNVREAIISGKAYRAAPLWRWFGRAGLTAGSVFWPITADEPIDWLLPEAWWDADKGNDPLRLQKLKAVSTPGLLDSLREFIGPSLEHYFESDTVKTSAAIYIMKTFRPNVLLLHYSHLDYLQHLHGPYSAEALRTLEMQDTQIGRIIATTRELGLFESTNFLIVSDHGHATIQQQIHPGALLAQEGFLRADSAGNVHDWKALPLATGGSCAIMVKESEGSKTVQALVRLFKNFAADPDHGIAYIFTGAELDSLGGNTDAALMLEAAPGFAFGGRFTGPVIRAATNRSTHGYLPSRPEMLAGFIAAGPAIRRSGQIGEINLLDLYPTIGRILSLRLPKREGKVMEQILAR